MLIEAGTDTLSALDNLYDLGKIRVSISREFYQTSCGIEGILTLSWQKKRNNIFKKVFLVLLIAISILPFILYQGDILFGRIMAGKKGG